MCEEYEAVNITGQRLYGAPLHGSKTGVHNWEPYTYEECRNLPNHTFVMTGIDGPRLEVFKVKITSIKTFKRKQEIDVHWKYGLYKFGIAFLHPESEIPFVKEV